MLTHTLHLPASHHRTISIPYAGSNSCPFCGSSFTPGTRCSCGVWCPSENSYKRPKFNSKRRKTPPSKLDIYRPQFDGIADRDPQQNHSDELSPYRALLDKIHDPEADQTDLDAEEILEIGCNDSVPWI